MFQLTEERAHLGPRRLRIIRYFVYYVEPAARSALLFVSVSQDSLDRAALNALDQVMDEASQKLIRRQNSAWRSSTQTSRCRSKSWRASSRRLIRFNVRTHFPIPSIDRDAWWLRVEGDVDNPFAINYEQLLELKSVTIPVTLECAGNNRNFLEPKVKGVQWGLGAVGTAEWAGVPLSILLDRARPKSRACEVILEGADGGMLEDPKSILAS